MISFINYHNLEIYFKLRVYVLGKLPEPPGFWSDNSNNGYKNISTCIENQYWQFQAHQLPEKPHINGGRTLNENLADIGGTRIAYFGYCKWF